MIEGMEAIFGNVPLVSTYDAIPRAKSSDKEYLESGSWKCSDSPTGAHYWIITRIKTGKIMICKHCKGVRRLPLESSP